MEILPAVEHGLIPFPMGDSVRLRGDVVRSGLVIERTGVKDWDADDLSFRTMPRALFAGSMVGLVPLTEGVSVLVEPRFPVNLTHMVNAVGASPLPLDILRLYRESGGDAEDWMLGHIAQNFVNSVEAVTAQGLLRNYVERRTATSSPKGRILVGATLMQHMARGVDYKATVAYFERTEENSPNQALVEGLHWVREWAESRREFRECWQKAVALLHVFRFVPRDRDGHFKHDIQVRKPQSLPESRSAYRRSLPLALALVERRGFSLDASAGELGLTSMLIKTDKVFEDFARLRLSEYLPDRSLTVVDGNTMAKRRLYAEARPEDIPAGAVVLALGTNTIEPDVLIESVDRTRLVLDMKYKSANTRDVVEQLVTYAHRLDCGRAVSVHPAAEGQASGLFVSGRIGNTTIYTYRVNLGAADLEDEMRRMAEALCALC